MILLAAQQSGSSADPTGALIGSVFSIVVPIFMIVAMWKLIAKAGRPGWASIVPIYNFVVMMQITGKSAWWILGMFVPFLNLYVYCRMMVNMAQVFGRGVGFGIGNIFLPFIFLPILAFGGATYQNPKG